MRNVLLRYGRLVLNKAFMILPFVLACSVHRQTVRSQVPPTEKGLVQLSIEPLPQREKVTSTGLKVTSFQCSQEKFEKGSFLAAKCSVEGEGDFDFYRLEICEVGLKTCRVENFFGPELVLVDLPSGKYQAKGQACLLPERLVDQPCGKAKALRFEIKDDADGEESKLRADLALVNQEIKATIHHIREQFVVFKNSRARSESESDELFDQYVENFINTNPYLLAEFYESQEFGVLLRQLEEEFAQKHQENLQLAEDWNREQRRQDASMAKGLLIIVLGALLIGPLAKAGEKLGPKIGKTVGVSPTLGLPRGRVVSPVMGPIELKYKAIRNKGLRMVGAALGAAVGVTVILYGALYFGHHVLLLAENPRSKLIQLLTVTGEKLESLKAKQTSLTQSLSDLHQ